MKNARVDQNVYNGTRKLVVADSDFMSPLEIIECVNQLKLKNCEGYDRIPQRILIDGIEVLIKPNNLCKTTNTFVTTAVICLLLLHS